MLKTPGGAAGASFCGRAKESRTDGRVVIIVRTTLMAEADGGGEGGKDLIETCSAPIYPERERVRHIRITGVCMPPPRTGRITKQLPRDMERVKRAKEMDTEAALLMVGDINTPTCTELYEEWRCEAGWWQLSDPDCATHKGLGGGRQSLDAPGGLSA